MNKKPKRTKRTKKSSRSTHPVSKTLVSKAQLLTSWNGDQSPSSVCMFLTLPETLSVAPMHHWAQ